MMNNILETVPAERIETIQAALFAEAGFHGAMHGSMVEHADDDLTVDFFEAVDAEGEEVEDEELTERLGLLLSENHFEALLSICEDYPDIIDADLIISF